MGYAQVQQFLVVPNLPDVVTYILYIISLIMVAFFRAFTKRDNSNAISKVDLKSKELEDAKKEFQKEKRAFERERKQMQKEFKQIKESIKEISNNSHELVSNGTANKVSKMIDNQEEVIEEEQDG